MAYIQISNTEEFRDLCYRLSLRSEVINRKKIYGNRVIAIDTEFMRRTSYHPKLSLLQIADEEGGIYIVDPTIIDITVFKDILINQEITKIVHSGLQDFQIFYNMFKIIPNNVFDTQIAASLLSIFKERSGYIDLCSLICNVFIDKSFQGSNWHVRPIPNEMLQYAANDVKYLHQIYEYLSLKISDKAHLDFLMRDKLLSEELYKLNARGAWRKVKYNNNIANHNFLIALREISAFREENASILDIPRGHFIPDKSLIKICQILPINNKEMSQIGLHRLSASHKAKLFDLCMGLRSIIKNIVA